MLQSHVTGGQGNNKIADFPDLIVDYFKYGQLLWLYRTGIQLLPYGVSRIAYSPLLIRYFTVYTALLYKISSKVCLVLIQLQA
jgi:hypothetical protein